jgi:hypothetical protein
LITVLDFPPPCRRMIAFNSDVEFTTWPAQLDLLRLFGQRGLETSFSYWMFSDPTYTWRMLDADGDWSKEAPVALQLARDGVFDTLHSFGGAAHVGGIEFERADIQRAYSLLQDNGVHTKIYSNHGTDRDVQNIGGPWSPPRVPPIDFRNYWAGDLPEHPCYHLDLTLQYGMRHFWLDIDRIRRRGWFDAAVDVEDAGLFTTQTSRDGSPILRFKRTDFNETPWPTTFATQISRALDDPAGGYSVVYNHFGFMRTADDKPAPNPPPYFDQPGYAALDRLVEAQRAGDVLVTSTGRLLNHALLMAARPWIVEETETSVVVKFQKKLTLGPVSLTLDWPDLLGFSILLDKPRTVDLQLGRERRAAQHWSSANQMFAGIPWTPLNVMDALDDALRLA